jgi:hypothetical protein
MDIRMMAFKADVFDDIESGLPNFPDLSSERTRRRTDWVDVLDV